MAKKPKNEWIDEAFAAFQAAVVEEQTARALRDSAITDRNAADVEIVTHEAQFVAATIALSAATTELVAAIMSEE